MGRPRGDAELVEEAKRGDSRAYELLLRAHEQVAFRVAFAILGSAGDAEEVTQDAFVKAHAALGRFRRGSPFRPWLLRIVGNEARNRRRAAGRRAHHEARAAAEVASGGAAPSPEAELMAAQRRQELFDAIDLLPADERLAIIGRFFIGLTDEEAAAVLGVRRGAVKMRVWRGLERLRGELGDDS